MHISPEEQLRRFEERSSIAYKRYKLTDEDWRNRAKWDDYKVAVEEMLVRTSTLNAPWTVVEANSKYWARIRTLRTLCEALSRSVEQREKK